MFKGKPAQFLLAIFAIIMLLIMPTLAIAHSVFDQYLQAEASAKGGY